MSVAHLVNSRIIDTHIHFDDDRFDPDRASIYQSARSQGVCAMVVPATIESRFTKIQQLATQYPGVFPTAGLHPMFCDHHLPAHLDTLAQTLHNCVAIGECGLDKSDQQTDLKQQRFYFGAQLELAKTASKPLIIHARNAVEDVLLMLKTAALSRTSGNGVIHSFNGSLQQAHRLIDLNYRISFGGPITYPGARKLRGLVESLPLEAMMFETDAPDQPGHAQRGMRNEPRWINQVITSAAELKQSTITQVASASNKNAISLFDLPESLLLGS